ncbi:MAG TPA: serine/threonine-protein kinase, partial [Thermoanaerobaculia bacterium]|nr:serine/threonine-protein kinase [Thermoanaerobaculia bacterium]
MPLTSGARLGPYEVTAKLGEGGMGEIWRARDTRLGREVAIKLLPERLADRATNLARFEREARAASSLNHPNIVTVHDVGVSETGPYLVMELVEGRTLRQMLARRRPMSVARVVDFAVQVADAMAAAHAAGIVHRDLKPENLIVGSDGRVKILDFGLAKLSAAPSGALPAPRSDDSTVDPAQIGAFAALNLSEPGMLVGTLGYMAPEQVRGSAVDFRADQFAFGTILYEVLTGVQPFERPTRIATLAAILDEDPEPLAERAAATPPPLRWIVERCLAKRPADRYASTLDLAHELHNLRDHLGETRSSGAGSSGTRRSPFASGPLAWGRGRVRAAAALLVVAGL